MFRFVNQKSVAMTAMTIAMLLVSGCGKGSSSNGSGGSAGQINPGTPGYPGYGNGGCVPITGAVPFTANNIMFDYANIIGGPVPGMQAYGQITVGGAYGTQYQYGQYMGNSPYGSISMSIGQTNYNNNGQYGYNQNGYASGTGSVTLSMLAQQELIGLVQSGAIPLNIQNNQQYNPYGGYSINPAQICVSAIAIDVGHYYNQVYGGYVWLYLNGTQHGYRMQF